MQSIVRSQRWWAALLALTAALVALPIVTGTHKAAAHPLGNFTINLYSRIELRSSAGSPSGQAGCLPSFRSSSACSPVGSAAAVLGAGLVVLVRGLSQQGFL